MTREPATLSAELSAFVLGAGHESIPDPVLRQAGTVLLDSFGTALANRNEAFVTALRGVLQRTVAAGDASVIGSSLHLAAEGAAHANSTAIHGSDLDATHIASIIHPSAIGIPVAIAAGEEWDVSGGEVLAAAICGMEALIRLGLAARGRYHVLGFQPTALLGPVVAALITARLAGMDEGRATEAAGLSTAIAAGLRSFSDDGTWGKRLITGWACRAGMHAAALVGAGYRGSTDALEKRWGLYPAFLRDEVPDLAAVTDGLGERWELLNTEIKRYPCSHGLHPFIESALALREQIGDPKRISEVRCVVNTEARRWWFEPAATRYRPDPYGARFSIPYVVARALLDGAVDDRAFSIRAVADAAALDLAARVRSVVDPELEDRPPVGLPGAMEVRLRGEGGSLSLVDAPHPTDNDTFVRERFMRGASEALGVERATALQAFLLDLASQARVRGALDSLMA